MMIWQDRNMSEWLATAPQHIPTQHDMLPQHLNCKYELNCEYYNIILARNKAPWWWSDKIETCRSVLRGFKSILCEIICEFVGWWTEVILKKMHGAAVRFIGGSYYQRSIAMDLKRNFQAGKQKKIPSAIGVSVGKREIFYYDKPRR